MSLSNADIWEEPSDHANRWMVSYADLMTVLFCLAIALLVVSKKQILTQHAQKENIPSEQVLVTKSKIQDANNQTKQIIKAAQNTSLKVLTFENGSLIIIPEKLIFKVGDASVERPEQLAELFQYLATLNKKLVVAGHTDNIPIASKMYASNWELSSARASSVARLLEQNGVSPYLLKVEGKSDVDPVSANDTLEGRQKNRRVTIFVSVD